MLIPGGGDPDYNNERIIQLVLGFVILKQARMELVKREVEKHTLVFNV